MNFEFTQDQQDLGEEARRFLTDKCPMGRLHDVLNSDVEYADDVWQGMVEQGWTATALPEVYGGFGMGYLELCLLALEIGRAAAPVPFSTGVYLAGECLLVAGSDAQKAELLPKLANGESIGTLALIDAKSNSTPDRFDTVVANGRLSGTKTVVPDAGISDYAIVAAEENEACSLFIVRLSENGVRRTRLQTIDPTRSHFRLEFHDVPVERLGNTGPGEDIIERVYDRAAVLMAFEQLGGAEATLEMSRKFANERIAFGRPIGAFQAIKHRLAEMYVSIEIARSNCYHGAYALANDLSDLPVAAAASRISASQTFYQCARDATQAHGGSGFAWNSDCHIYYRRAKQLSLALGGERNWKNKLITRLVDDQKK